MSAANRRRGARAEVAVVNYLRTVGWPDARRYLAGDGRQPGDVDWHPLVALEVKDRAESAWPTWCRQATAEAREGMVPVVIRRTRGVVDVGAWECRWPEWASLGDGPLVGPFDLAYGPLVDGEPWMTAPFARFVELVRHVDRPVTYSLPPTPDREDTP